MVIELYKTTVQRRGREPLKSLISVSKHALKHLERGWGVLCYLECLLYFRGNLQTRLAAPSSVFRRLDKPSRPRCASMPGVRRFARKEAKGEINVKVGNEKSVFCLCNILVGRLFADSIAAAGIWENFCDFWLRQRKQIHRYPHQSPVDICNTKCGWQIPPWTAYLIRIARVVYCPVYIPCYPFFPV